jgi:hypothetical protein
VLAFRAATRTAHEQVGLLGSRRVRRDCYCRCRDQDKVPKNADGQYRVAAKRDGETDGPHEPQCLQDKMASFGIRNMAQRTYVSIEYEIPSGDDLLSHKALPDVILEILGQLDQLPNVDHSVYHCTCVLAGLRPFKGARKSEIMC